MENLLIISPLVKRLDPLCHCGLVTPLEKAHIRMSTIDQELARFIQLRRNKSSERSFHFAAPTVWNSLPSSLHNIANFLQFKAHLKTHLFPQAFLNS